MNTVDLGVLTCDCPSCGEGVRFDEDGLCMQCGRDTIPARTPAAGSAHEPKPNAGQQETLTTWALCPRCGDRVVTKFEAGPPWNGKTVFVAHAAKGSSPRVHCRESGQEPTGVVKPRCMHPGASGTVVIA